MLSENVKIFPDNFIFTFRTIERKVWQPVQKLKNFFSPRFITPYPEKPRKKIFRDPQVQNISIYGALMALLFFRIEGASKLSPFFTFLKF